MAFRNIQALNVISKALGFVSLIRNIYVYLKGFFIL